MTDVALKASLLQNVRGLIIADGGGATWSFDPATNTLSVAIASGGVAGFTESAQDAVFGAIADSTSIDVTYNDAGNSFSLAVLPAGVNHNALNNYVADEHVAHSGVTLTAGAGLTGGGTIAASRTFAVGAGTGITVNADDVAVNTATAFSWTGVHTFTPNGRTVFNGIADDFIAGFSGNTGSGHSYGVFVQAGTTSADVSFVVNSAATGNRDYLRIKGDGAVSLGNTTDNPALTLLGNGATTLGGTLKVVGNSGFNNTAPIAKPTVSGSRGGNAALASLLTALANYGLITDSTSA